MSESRDAPRPLRRPRRLAVFGAHSEHDFYQRNRVLVGLFKELSETVVEIRPNGGEALHGFASKHSWLEKILRNLKDMQSLWSQRHGLADCDTVFIPYPSYLPLLMLRMLRLGAGKQVIVDAFLELHSTVVEDRALFPRDSLRARLLLAFQRASLGYADLALIDTARQAQLLLQRLQPRQVPVLTLPVGIDETLWRPRPQRESGPGPRRVLFWGTFIPLHGISCIVAAARILHGRGADVEFRLIGDGQTAPALAAALEREPLASLRWERTLVDTDTLIEAVTDADLVLGIFGASDKAASVIPYKVHQALASNRPVISRSSPVMDEVADAELGLVLCPPDDAEALADAIEALIKRLESGWVANTRRLYDRHFSSQRLRSILSTALAER